MTWRDYLLEERTQQLEQISFLGSGNVRLHVTTNGVQRDVTEERLETTKKHLAEVEQILREEGVPFDV